MEREAGVTRATEWQGDRDSCKKIGLGMEIAVCQRHSKDGGVDDGRQKRRRCVPLCSSASRRADLVILSKPLARLPSPCLSREQLHIVKAGSTPDAMPSLPLLLQ